MINVNDYVLKLLSDKDFVKKEYSCFVSNNYIIEGVEGVISPNLLHKVICRAKKSKFIRWLLCDILTYIDSTSISDENFKALLKFPKKYRTTYLSCMGHTQLSFYQMQILNNYPLALEAFSWLFNNICQYDIFTVGDMLHILSNNPDVQSIAVQKCIDQASKEYGDSPKLELARWWLAK